MANTMKTAPTDEEDIAIVGMSIFCPGAKTVGEFWRNLVGGVDSITDVPPEVIESWYFGAPDNKLADKFYCNRGGFAPHAIADPLRYGIMPVTAEGLDPDQLMSLMLAEEALYDAGIPQKGISLDNASIILGRGNFAGLPQLRAGGVVRYANEIIHLLHHALPDLSQSQLDTVKKDYQSFFGRYAADTATSSIPNLPASAVANHFDMHGPAYLLDGACASGIIALEQGITLISSGQSDIALIGCMHTEQNAVFWSAFNLMGALSQKGVIAPFSKDADGLLIGQGGGYLVIKTVRRAIEDDDRIYAVVKATASGSDGGGHSVLVTNAEGQIKVLERAWKRAGMDPADVGYVEGHGTGTPVGDATEVETLTRMFGDDTAPPAYVGSVKSNIGHLMPAAGMAGLVKTALALYNRAIPATLHCENPSDALKKSRFDAPQETIDWVESGLPLIAGVDAFGFGGVDSHAVLTAYEEPPAKRVSYLVDRRKMLNSPPAYVISSATLDDLLIKLDYKEGKNYIGSFIGAPDDRYRLVVFDPTDARIKQAAQIAQRDQPWFGRSDIWFTNDPCLLDGGQVAFMFPGWDANEVVEHDSIVDELGLTWPEEDQSVQSEEAERQYHKLRSAAGAEADSQDRSFADDIIDRTNMAQLVDEALRKTGVKADLYIGHSIGEWHAARAIGMIDSSQALMMDHFFFDPKNTIPGEYLPDFHSVAINGKLSQKGKERFLEIPDVWMTNDNCPSQLLLCVLGHSLAAVQVVAKTENVFCQVLPFGSSIHTPMINDVMDVLLEQLSTIPVKEGDAPLWSAETRALIQPNQSADRAFGEQFSEPVLFRQLIGDLYDRVNARVFIQIGGGSLPQFVEDTLKGRPFAAISSVVNGRKSVDQLRRVHALLFVMGREPNLAFMGVHPIYRSGKSIYYMPLGAPIIEDLPSLDEALADYVHKSVPEAPPTPTNEQSIQSQPASVPNLWRRGMGILPPRGFTRGYYQPPVQSIAASVSGQTIGDAPSPPPSAHLPPVPPPSPVLQGETSSVPAMPKTPAPTTSMRGGTRFEEPLEIDTEKYPFLEDHSIVNQPIGWSNPEDLYPVVPMTMSIQLLADIAKKHAPGQRVIKVSSITAMDFIPASPAWNGVVQGFWRSENELSLTIPGHFMMTVTMGTEAPPVPTEWVEKAKQDLGGPRMEPIPRDRVYNDYSFHRERYRSLIRSLEFADNGFDNLITKREGMGSLLDQMGQSVGLYLHLYEDNNRVSFPVRVSDITFYQDMDDQEGTFEHYCVVRNVTDTFITADCIYTRDNKVWAIARGWANQRLGIDSAMWSIVLEPETKRLAIPIADDVFWVGYGGTLPNRTTMIFLYLRYLTSTEKKTFLAISSTAAQNDYIAGRIALKDTVRSALKKGDAYPYPIEVDSYYDDKGKLYVRWEDGHAFTPPIEVSLSHKNEKAVCVIRDHPVGIDMETLEHKDQGFWDLAFTPAEQELLRAQPDPDLAAIQAWVAKEAYGKMTGAGLGGNPKKNAVSAIDGNDLTINDVHVVTTQYEGYVIGWTK